MNENDKKSEIYKSVTAWGIEFFYHIEWEQEQKVYLVRFQYGSELDGIKIIFGDELKSFSTNNLMKKEVETLQTYCKTLGYTLWQNSVKTVMTDCPSPPTTAP